MTLVCTSFSATPLPGGQIRLEIESSTPDIADDRLSLKEIAARLKKSVKTIDKLSRRQKNPLPLVRGLGCRPYGFRSQIDAWLLGPTKSSSIQSLFAAS